MNMNPLAPLFLNGFLTQAIGSEGGGFRMML